MNMSFDWVEKEPNLDKPFLTEPDGKGGIKVRAFTDEEAKAGGVFALEALKNGSVSTGPLPWE